MKYIALSVAVMVSIASVYGSPADDGHSKLYQERKDVLAHRGTTPTALGGLVVEGSEFEHELKKVQAGELEDIDWSHYTAVNGTLVYSATPIDHQISKRADTQYGTVCMYKDSLNCNSGTYYCWHSLDDGVCLGMWVDNVSYGFVGFWKSFADVNFWTCDSDGNDNCAYSTQQWGPDLSSSLCLHNAGGHRWAGLFKWHS